MGLAFEPMAVPSLCVPPHTFRVATLVVQEQQRCGVCSSASPTPTSDIVQCSGAFPGPLSGPELPQPSGDTGEGQEATDG